jgi:hypothetical protein
MSSPIPVIGELKYRLLPANRTCAKCHSLLNNAEIRKIENNIFEIKCSVCNCNYLLCPECNRISLEWLMPGDHTLTCNHCHTGLLHGGVSFLGQLTQKDQANLKLIEHIRIIYTIPIKVDDILSD